MISKSILKKLKINNLPLKSKNILEGLHRNLLDSFDHILEFENILDIKSR